MDYKLNKGMIFVNNEGFGHKVWYQSLNVKSNKLHLGDNKVENVAMCWDS